ncbi:MAG TPA: hypothetical protein VG325_06870 [Solirubrobacteraceae bacterium]|jgi:hypothetical protein|nr:hypothetical protein [Solirubrobacteraceae bacterium]
MSDELDDPYQRLASLIEYELQLAGERRFDELLALKEARAKLQASLPATPPDTARPELERCALLDKRVEIELLRVREAILQELTVVRQAQRAADGYAPVRAGGRRVSAQA